MAYRVLWAPDADSQLEAMVAQAVDAPAIAAAARMIDQMLTNSPFESSESRFEEGRIAFSTPLGVQFQVLDDVKTVVVFDV